MDWSSKLQVLPPHTYTDETGSVWQEKKDAGQFPYLMDEKQNSGGIICHSIIPCEKLGKAPSTLGRGQLLACIYHPSEITHQEIQHTNPIMAQKVPWS